MTTATTITTAAIATASSTAAHPVVPRDEWLAARRAFLAREKAFTRERDRLAAERRALPWVRLDKVYVFQTPQGPRTLAQLFDGRSQLLVQHFMFAPGWEQGCKSCSFMADHLDAEIPHLAQRDLAVVVVSRATLPEIERFRARMGWKFRWASSHDSDFNRDFAVSFAEGDRVDGRVDYNYGRAAFPMEEAPGISLFRLDDDGAVFHTYSTYGRGVEAMMGTYDLLDLAPRGRDEDALEHTMAWVRHHDRYEAAPAAAPVASCCANGR